MISALQAPDLSTFRSYRATRFGLRALISLCLAAATPYAEAETAPSPCAARKEVVARLAERYGETLRSVGLNRDNALLEVYASEETGSWTILLTDPAGRACLVASGEMWEPNAAPRTDKDA